MSNKDADWRAEELKARAGLPPMSYTSMPAHRGNEMPHTASNLEIHLIEPDAGTTSSGNSVLINLGQTNIDERMPQYYTWETPDGWFRIDIRIQALETVHAHASSLENRKAEIFGLLWGHFDRRRGQVLTIEHALVTSIKGDEMNFTVKGDDWVEITNVESDLKRQHPDCYRVGWYHTHPKMDIFYSENDKDVHRLICPEVWMVGLVYDPFKCQGSFIVRDNRHELVTERDQLKSLLFKLPDAYLPEAIGSSPAIMDGESAKTSPQPEEKGKRNWKFIPRFSGQTRKVTRKQWVACILLACLFMSIGYWQRDRIKKLFPGREIPTHPSQPSIDLNSIVIWKNGGKMEVRWNREKTSQSDLNLKIARKKADGSVDALTPISWNRGQGSVDLPQDSTASDQYIFDLQTAQSSVSTLELALTAIPDSIEAKLEDGKSIKFTKPNAIPAWGTLRVYRTEFPDKPLFEKKLSSTSKIGEIETFTSKGLPDVSAQHSRYCVVWNDTWGHWTQMVIPPPTGGSQQSTGTTPPKPDNKKPDNKKTENKKKGESS